VDFLSGLGGLNFTQQFFIGLLIAILVGIMLRLGGSGPHGPGGPRPS